MSYHRWWPIATDGEKQSTEFGILACFVFMMIMMMMNFSRRQEHCLKKNIDQLMALSLDMVSVPKAHCHKLRAYNIIIISLLSLILGTLDAFLSYPVTASWMWHKVTFLTEYSWFEFRDFILWNWLTNHF